MPNYFQLTKKGQTEPMALQDIDKELCAHLGVEVHPTEYVNWWVDNIGYALAMGVPLVGSKKLHNGQDFSLESLFDADWATHENQRFRDTYARHVKIVAYLRENFTECAWAMNGNCR